MEAMTMARYGTQFNDRENKRANQKIPAHSVPSGPSGRGADCGGTPNLRANPDSPATSIPASGPRSHAKRIPFDTFEDRSV
jgi:hypothetical protein